MSEKHISHHAKNDSQRVSVADLPKKSSRASNKEVATANRRHVIVIEHGGL